MPRPLAHSVLSRVCCRARRYVAVVPQERQAFMQAYRDVPRFSEGGGTDLLAEFADAKEVGVEDSSAAREGPKRAAPSASSRSARLACDTAALQEGCRAAW